MNLHSQKSLFESDHISSGEYGSMSIRVVVLPKKSATKTELKKKPPQEVLDLGEDEIIDEPGATAMSSYLETSKGGKQCVVFLVNGQKQDSLDNTFIVQKLGYKYLRHRMMIVVDLDNLSQDALGRLMQGSRQSFYSGDVFDAVKHSLITTVKGDPDLDKLEREAEEEVAELKSGDAKVKQTLDQLIDSHHEFANRLHSGEGGMGGTGESENLGFTTQEKDGVVSLLSPKEGVPADYPVLESHPASSTIRLFPNQTRNISVRSLPSNSWPALGQLMVNSDPSVPELSVSQEKLSDHLKLTLQFNEPEDFDADQYPLRATVSVNAKYNGIPDSRRIDLNIIVKPQKEIPPPELQAIPTWLRVSSRQPIKITLGPNATHARLRWNGLDELVTGSNPTWQFTVKMLTEDAETPVMSFSDPKMGRFSLLIYPVDSWSVDQELEFEVRAVSTDGNTLTSTFKAIVKKDIIVEPPTPKEPRQIEADSQFGSMRRPPYDLKYIDQDGYDTDTCWSEQEWSDVEPGCFQMPTDRSPLTLIINNDFEGLRVYRKYIVKQKKLTESDIERRINKYTSHIAFHLYQMFKAIDMSDNLNFDEIEKQSRQEIQRVASTLLKLMEVSR